MNNALSGWELLKVKIWHWLWRQKKRYWKVKAKIKKPEPRDVIVQSRIVRGYRDPRRRR